MYLGMSSNILDVLTLLWPRRRGRPRTAMALLGGVLLSSPASTQIYPDAALAAKRARILENVVFTVEHDIPASAAPHYRTLAASARLDLPLRSRTFLNFKTVGSTVTVPVDALQFIDDLAVLQAWLVRNNCDGQALPNYVFHLVSSAGQTKGPMAAFGINRDDLLQDTFINNLSYNLYTSAVWFLLAHEVGHVALGQAGPSATAQEDAADAFALDTMRRKRLLPVGIFLYMIAISLTDQGRAVRTHSTNAQRIVRVAAALRTRPEDFVAANSRDPARDRNRVLDNVEMLSRLGGALTMIAQKEAELAARGMPIIDVRSEVFPAMDYRRACIAPG